MKRALLPLFALLAVAACGRGETAAPDAGLVEVLRTDSSVATSSAWGWTALRDVLPNVTYAHDGAGQQLRERISDSAVVGRVVRTEPTRGMPGEPLTAGEDVSTRVLSFDDPRASWRVLSVTVEVLETLAGPSVDELVLDGFLNGPSGRGKDARVVGRALRGLGRIVVVSKAWPEGPEFVPGRAALPFGYGVGRGLADETLDFPLIAPGERPSAEDFMDGIDTLAELRAEARGPQRTQGIRSEAP